MIFQTANHWCNLVETGQAGDKQRLFPGETKLKWNKIKPDENYDIWLVVFPCFATSQKTTPCSIQPVSCIAHNAAQPCNYPDVTHLEWEGAHFKLIYIWGFLWRGNFCSRTADRARGFGSEGSEMLCQGWRTITQILVWKQLRLISPSQPWKWTHPRHFSVLLLTIPSIP